MKLPPAGRVRGVLAAMSLVMVLVQLLPGAQTAPYDLVIRNARILDGTGSPWFRGAIGIRGDVITRIAPAIEEPATETIDTRGQVVAPGFIDIHTHARRGIFEVPTADNYVRQGVTTVIEGPDGSSPLPLGAFLAKLAATPRSVNIGSFVGQGSIRETVIGPANRAATVDERAKMRHAPITRCPDAVGRPAAWRLRQRRGRLPHRPELRQLHRR